MRIRSNQCFIRITLHVYEKKKGSVRVNSVFVLCVLLCICNQVCTNEIHIYIITSLCVTRDDIYLASNWAQKNSLAFHFSSLLFCQPKIFRITMDSKLDGGCCVVKQPKIRNWTDVLAMSSNKWRTKIVFFSSLNKRTKKKNNQHRTHTVHHLLVIIKINVIHFVQLAELCKFFYFIFFAFRLLESQNIEWFDAKIWNNICLSFERILTVLGSKQRQNSKYLEIIILGVISFDFFLMWKQAKHDNQMKNHQN